MKSHDFWIGDSVMILSTGKSGKVEGEDRDGKLKVRISKTNEHVRVAPADLKVITEKPLAKKIKETEERMDLRAANSFNLVIDLHLECLPDYNPRTWKADELSFQEHSCLKFLKTAIQLRVQKVLIIHGKGDGVLRSSVEKILHDLKEVSSTELVNNGGATEVWFRY